MNICKNCGQPLTLTGSNPTEVCLCNQKTQPALPLVESEDFYYEDGLMVFTETYHLKKGYCCGNNCRHCPY